LLANTIAHDKEVILLGDLNVDLLKSEDNSAQLINLITAYQFSLLNSMKPTRSFNGSESLIDHLFANFQSSYRIDIMPIDFYDHDAVFRTFDNNYKLPIGGTAAAPSNPPPPRSTFDHSQLP
jgi:hypothetical protein